MSPCFGPSPSPGPYCTPAATVNPPPRSPEDQATGGCFMDDIKQQTSSTARAVGEAIGHKAEEVADRSREAGAEGVARAARTAGAMADAVADDVPAVADYVRGAAQKIERL